MYGGLDDLTTFLWLQSATQEGRKVMHGPGGWVLHPRTGAFGQTHVGERLCVAQPECGDAAARTAGVVVRTVQKLQRK